MAVPLPDVSDTMFQVGATRPNRAPRRARRRGTSASAARTSTLSWHHLVDALWLFTHSVTRGAGRALFNALGHLIELDFLEPRSFDNA